MKVIAAIPARYNSTRFPGKLLKPLGSKTVLQHVYDQVKNSKLFDQIIIATDDNRIFNHATNFGATPIFTSSSHQSGTDRIAEACENFEFDIVINVQGDEPFITAQPLEKLISSFSDQTVQYSTLITKLEKNKIADQNIVKVVISKFNKAIYFSRSIVPFSRDLRKDIQYYQHIGVYGFRREALYRFVNWPLGYYEQIENLEQLRILENGYQIHTVLSDYHGKGIDTESDLKSSIQLLSS